MPARDFEALNMPVPRRTFLDGRTGSARGSHGAAAASYGGGSTAPRQGSAGMVPTAPAQPAPGTLPHDTKNVILAEHRTELLDMLNESVAKLKNVYRTKFVMGEHLRHVDPSYGGDSVNQFNLTTPPTFDPAYNAAATPGAVAEDEEADIAPGGGGGGGGGGGAGSDAAREKLRTAEELIKKLYRRNTQLEVDNKYTKAEINRMERHQGISRTATHNLSITDGHIPCDHPLYTPKMRRRCRSGPPQRVLLRTAVDGFGLTFPARAGTRDEPPPKEDAPAVQQLKKRVLQLTEALVSVQHDNELLVGERSDIRTLRDRLLRQYLTERDHSIASVHGLLQEVIGKVMNPMKLSRSKQPSLNINPVVATKKVLKEVSARLAEQIASVTDNIVKTASNGLPAAPTSPARGRAASAVSPAAMDVVSNDGTPSGAAVDGAGGEKEAGARRKELARRLRGVVDTLPANKRKQLLLVLSELKELYTSLAHSNQSVLGAFDDHKAKHHQESVQLKLQIALLRDQLRSLGVTDDEMGGGGGSPHRAAHSARRDP
jgi:hypothetical protein